MHSSEVSRCNRVSDVAIRVQFMQIREKAPVACISSAEHELTDDVRQDAIERRVRRGLIVSCVIHRDRFKILLANSWGRSDGVGEWPYSQD
jgi:hypothetical protein